MFRPAPGHTAHEEESYYVPCLFISLFSLSLFFLFFYLKRIINKKRKEKKTPRQVYAQWKCWQSNPPPLTLLVSKEAIGHNISASHSYRKLGLGVTGRRSQNQRNCQASLLFLLFLGPYVLVGLYLGRTLAYID
ncbi:hypothetical protein BDV36DRAFT_176019 [Aspergillus pseudocaelatus]|uniref:Uncharacterized protein n=1 Tax=Aspergillus pseudocaelatus TaxID=1825620 RepID=A0ABQ6WKG9_9EURO|nr:hypothetical protein BDV36DRAFT_176019 [Aspergillus pseudocaelatus]